ncbi:MAG: hypothetical protein SGJ16_06655 [Nitrospirota bacterium]|nr:hypothetical protein [Nitrospirota bacterium]
MANIRTASLLLFLSTVILTPVANAEDYSRYLEKLKGQLASETKLREIEKLKEHIARIEERQREEGLTPEELLAEAEGMQCSPQDGMCLAKKSNTIHRAKSNIASKAQKLESKRTLEQIQELMQKDQKRRDAERDKQEKNDHLEAEAREKEFKEQEHLEQEQKDHEETASDKAMSDYVASRMKQFAGDKSLVTIKPGSKLCVFPDSGMGYLFVEDVDKNKVHAITEYSRHPLKPTHKAVVRKHPKFDGKLELEFIEHGLRMFSIEDLQRVRVATERCRF